MYCNMLWKNWVGKTPILWFKCSPTWRIIICRKWWVLFLGILLLASCTLKMAYQYADWIALWSIDDYFDLNSEQKERLETTIQRHLTWHKNSELLTYVALLKELKQKSQDGLDFEEIDWFFTNIEQLRKNLVNRVLPDTSAFLADLTEEQIQFFETQLLEFNESALERAQLSPEERLERRVERTLELLEDWFGELSPDQQKEISQLSRKLPETLTERIKLRETRQKEFIALLRSGRGAQVIHEQLIVWFVNVEQAYPSHYQQMIREQKEAVKQMMLSVDRILIPEQRAHAIEQIDELIEDMEDIISS